MTLEILDGIVAAIIAEFGEESRVYLEDVEQNLDLPAFLVSVLNPADTRYRGRRRKHSARYVVQYIPDGENPRQQCYEVAERLCRCMEVVSLPSGLIRAAEVETDTQGDALTWMADYTAFLLEETPEEKMEQIKQAVQTKG